MSATGAGEVFIRAAVAHEISARVRHLGEACGEAADAVLTDVKALGGTGGVIVVTADGGHWAFNTPGMYRGKASGTGERLVAVYGDET